MVEGKNDPKDYGRLLQMIEHDRLGSRLRMRSVHVQADKANGSSFRCRLVPRQRKPLCGRRYDFWDVIAAEGPGQ